VTVRGGGAGRRSGVGASAVAYDVASLWGGDGPCVCRRGLGVRRALSAHSCSRSASPFLRGTGRRRRRRGRIVLGVARGCRLVPAPTSSTWCSRCGLGFVRRRVTAGRRSSSTSARRHSGRRGDAACGQTLGSPRSRFSSIRRSGRHGGTACGRALGCASSSSLWRSGRRGGAACGRTLGCARSLSSWRTRGGDGSLGCLASFRSCDACTSYCRARGSFISARRGRARRARVWRGCGGDGRVYGDA
jgi:hypothetical protein